MQSRIFPLVVTQAILFTVLAIAFWQLYFQGQRPLAQLSLKIDSVTGLSSPSPVTEDVPEVALQLTEVARGLVVPWSIVFTTPSRMIVTERVGTVRVIEDDKLLATPLHTFAEVPNSGEEGLMGMALDPNYEQNNYLYFSLAYGQKDTLAVKVVRLTDNGTKLTDELTIIDNLPAAQYHSGSRIKFGPDQKLYITTGDATDRNIAQDMSSLGGKILRLNADGSIPTDNPFVNSPVYSLGHRNPQGIDWHPVSKVLYQTEHGPSGFDGAGGGDEVNVIAAGKNYGWPLVSHDKSRADLISPVVVYTPAVAPASGTFYASTVIPQFTNHYFFGGLRGEGIYRVKVNIQDTTKIDGYDKITQVKVGRVREVVEGPDGALYFSTSNTDGRGEATVGDDKIFRLFPTE